MTTGSLAAFAAVAALVLAGASYTQASTETSPWYDTNYGAAQSRANLQETVLTPSVAGHIKPLRSVTAPAPPASECGYRTLSPILVGGALYAVTGATISKYNAATGKLIWRKTPDPSYDSRVVSLGLSGSLLIGSEIGCSPSHQGSVLLAYSTSTGSLVWKTSFANDSGPPTAGTAVISGGYIVAAGADVGGNSTTVYHLSNGARAWPPPTGSLGCGEGTGGGPPLVVRQLVIADACGADGFGSESLEARNLTTGTIAWNRPGGWTYYAGDRSGSTGTHLYATNPAGSVVDLNPATGQTVYTLSHASQVLAVDSSRVYAACTTGLCAYSISTGALKWQYPQSPAIVTDAGGLLYLDDGDVLNATTGKHIRWLFSGGASALAVGDGRIAAVTDPRVIDLYGLSGY